MYSFLEPAAAAGWRTGGWNGRRSVMSADSMPQAMMVPDRGYTYSSAELSYKLHVHYHSTIIVIAADIGILSVVANRHTSG